MIFIRLYLILAGLAVIASLLVGLLLKDRRWFRFAWQLAKFSVVFLIVFTAAVMIGRIIIF